MKSACRWKVDSFNTCDSPLSLKDIFCGQSIAHTAELTKDIHEKQSQHHQGLRISNAIGNIK